MLNFGCPDSAAVGSHEIGERFNHFACAPLALSLPRTHDPPERGVRKIPSTAWWLWDGDRSWRVPALTPEQQKYPLQGIANTQLLKERIVGGWRSENDPWAGGD